MMPIGPSIATLWTSQFRRASQFGTSDPWDAFITGAGTVFPLPSMPLAQAARYWWSAQEWRIQYSLTTPPDPTDGTTTTDALDTGFIPYSVGSNGGDIGFANQRLWCVGGTGGLSGSGFSGGSTSLFAAPSLSDRCTFGSFQLVEPVLSIGMFNGSIAAAQGNLSIGIMGSYSQPYSDGPGPFDPGNLGGLVYDEGIPGNVFMALYLSQSYGTQLSSVNPGGALTASSAMASLDGMPIMLYDLTTPGMTGSITINTKDT